MKEKTPDPPSTYLSEFLESSLVRETMSIKSTISDCDAMLHSINNLNEPELRSILQHIAVVHPEVAQAALKHVQQQFDDVYSVMTVQASNRKRMEDDPPPTASLAHPSKRGGADDADDGPPLRSGSQRPQPRPSMPPPVPRRRSVSPTIPTNGPTRQVSSDYGGTWSDDDLTIMETTTSPPGVCYLMFDFRNSRMMVHYSREPSASLEADALGMWTPEPPHRIREIKFVENSGKHELIGNCSPTTPQGRRNYYSAVCLFVRLARVVNGTVTMFPTVPTTTTLDFDIFLYYHDSTEKEFNSYKAPTAGEIDTVELDAIACLPKNTNFYRESNRNVSLVKWMGGAAELGSATRFKRSSNNASGTTDNVNNHRLSPPQPPHRMVSSPSLKRTLARKASTDAP